MREELEADRQRRLEETRKQIEAETRRALEQIRLEVVDLSLLAATKVTRKSLDDADHKRLIEEAVGELDFSVLEGNEQVSVVDRVYATRAVRGRARARTGSSRSASSWRSSSRPSARCPSCASCCATRRSTRARARAALEDVLAGSEELLRNFLLVLADKGRAGAAGGDRERVRAPGRRARGHRPRRADDRGRALRRRGPEAAAADRAGLGPQGRGDPQRSTRT